MSVTLTFSALEFINEMFEEFFPPFHITVHVLIICCFRFKMHNMDLHFSANPLNCCGATENQNCTVAVAFEGRHIAHYRRKKRESPVESYYKPDLGPQGRFISP